MDNLDDRRLRQLLGALGDHLASAGDTVAVLVVGGAALALRGWVARSTHDVDVLALVDHGQLEPPAFPPSLVGAAARVARQFGLAPDWLNAEIGAQWTTGLPEGVGDEVEWLTFGGLRVGLAGRRTLITLKLFAAADQEPSSVHTQDLLVLSPTDEELDRARDWVLGQDISPEFPRIVDEVVRHVQRGR